MKGSLSSVLLLSSLCAAGAVQAGQLYVSGAFGQASSEEDIFDSDTGFRLGGGIQFNPNLAVELNFVDFGSFEMDGAGVTAITSEVQNELEAEFPGIGFAIDSASAAAEVSGFEASLIGGVPLNEMFEIYARLGLFAWDLDLKASGRLTVNDSTGTYVENFSGTESESGTDLVFGAGAEMNFTPNVSAHIEYATYAIEDSDVRFLAAGIRYQF